MGEYACIHVQASPHEVWEAGTGTTAAMAAAAVNDTPKPSVPVRGTSSADAEPAVPEDTDVETRVTAVEMSTAPAPTAVVASATDGGELKVAAMSSSAVTTAVPPSSNPGISAPDCHTPARLVPISISDTEAWTPALSDVFAIKQQHVFDVYSTALLGHYEPVVVGHNTPMPVASAGTPHDDL